MTCLFLDLVADKTLLYSGNFQETCQEHTVEFLPPVDDDDTDPPFVIIQSDCRWVEGTMFYSSGSLCKFLYLGLNSPAF